MIVNACCKINLGLDILRRRDDGYHDLETVMVPVRELCDRIEIERTHERGVRFDASGLAVDCPDEDNLCLKAFRLMQAQYGVDGVRIRLDKRIPFGAGLGGGSSDATAVLRALNELFGLQLPAQRLVELASRLGSDTAFFVYDTPQLCTGRGEVMTPLRPALDGLTLVLVKPPVGVSTREAYAGVVPSLPAVRLAERLARPVEEWRATVGNDFEPSVFARHPEIGAVKQALLASGAVYASMSGSGSAVYGLFAAPPRELRLAPGCFVHRETIR